MSHIYTVYAKYFSVTYVPLSRANEKNTSRNMLGH
jgi:hypothetical protein